MLSSSFEGLLDREDIPALIVFIGHIVHALLYHKYTEASDSALLGRKRSVRVGLGEWVVLLSVIRC